MSAPVRLSFWGYLTINVVVVLICVAIFLTLKYGWWDPYVGHLISTTGMVPLLVFVPVCFMVVSVYDAFFDRVVRRREGRRRPPASASRSGPGRHGD